eukprot:3143045-Amphidinium_carterae.1
MSPGSVELSTTNRKALERAAALMPYRWAWREDESRYGSHEVERRNGDNYVLYPEAVSQQLEAHYRLWKADGESSRLQFLQMEIGDKRHHGHTGSKYDVNFQVMMQRNVSTLYCRRLVRLPLADIPHEQLA